MRKYLLKLLIMLVFVATLSAWPVMVSATIGTPITVPLATQPVTIDGQWTSSSEWSDAVEVKYLVAQGTAPAYFRLKHDANFLYVLSDNPSDPAIEYSDATGHGDILYVVVDPLLNGGSAPQTDDYRFQIQASNASVTNIFMWRGNGAGWVQQCGGGPCYDYMNAGYGKLGLDSGNSPYAPYPHVVAEGKIPLSILPNPSFGLFIRMIDSSEAMSLWFYWPGPTQVTQITTPDAWGTVTLSSTPIPEFSGVFAVTAIALVSAAYLTRRKRK
jgi:hypothetical protein